LYGSSGQSMLQLRMLRLMYELQPVRVNVLRTCKTIPGMDTPIQKGSQISLPRFVAEILEGYGIAEIVESTLTYQDIAKVKFSHMQQRGNIPKIDDFFYTKVKDSVKRLISKAKTESDIVLLRNVRKDVYGTLPIYLIPGSQLYSGSFQLRSVDVIEKNCTIEERLLISLIKSVYDKWIKEYVEYD